MEAMRTGIFGHIGLCREIMKKDEEEFSLEAKLLGTGGVECFCTVTVISLMFLTRF